MRHYDKQKFEERKQYLEYDNMFIKNKKGQNRKTALLKS